MKTVFFKFALDEGYRFSDFVECLRKNRLGDTSDTGFELQKVTTKRIVGSFFSRRIRRLNVSTASGETEVLSRESVERVEFEVDLGRKLLSLFDPKREKSRFVSQLISNAGFRLTLEPLYHEVDQLLEKFSESNSEYSVLQVLLFEVVLAKGIFAKVSATGDLSQNALSGKVGKLRGKVASFRLRLPHQGRNRIEQEICYQGGGKIEFPGLDDKKKILGCLQRLGMVSKK